MTKQKIPKALREQVWITYCGKTFEKKCVIRWCENSMTPFTFEVGHNIPESKGGTLNIENLRPICSKCNKSMGNTYTIDEFSSLSTRSYKVFECFKFSKCTSMYQNEMHHQLNTTQDVSKERKE